MKIKNNIPEGFISGKDFLISLGSILKELQFNFELLLDQAEFTNFPLAKDKYPLDWLDDLSVAIWNQYGVEWSYYYKKTPFNDGVTMYEVELKNILRRIIYIWDYILNLTPQSVIDQAMVATESKNHHLENDSPYQKQVMEAFAQEYVNFESTELNNVNYGNRFNIMLRILRSGVGFDYTEFIKRLSYLFRASYSVSYGGCEDD